MITVNGYKIIPTIFPDGTSQVWKLPDEVLNTNEYNVVWNFENERELIDLLSLHEILFVYSNFSKFMFLHIPYFPYARQDKMISNGLTFNFRLMANILNQLHFDRITTIDLHNHAKVKHINKLLSLPVNLIHEQVLDKVKPDWIIFPDKGALERYYYLTVGHNKTITFDKIRDQSTGNILGLESKDLDLIKYNETVLMVDDICDGGATFIAIANILNHKFNNTLNINLFTTHGIYSKGEQVLTDARIKLLTTNSLLKNKDGYKV